MACGCGMDVVWYVGLALACWCGVAYGCDMFVQHVGVVCGCGMWVWHVSVVWYVCCSSGCGMWV